jgi:hypothetical protein
MGGIMKLGLSIVTAALAAAALGCGGGNSATADTAPGKPRLYPWLKGPSREFLVPHGDNVVQTFGREGTAEERAEATALVAGWLRARAARDWKKDCSYFSRGYVGVITKDAHGVTGGRVKSCPEALAYFKQAASGDYVDTLRGSTVASLRVGKGSAGEGESAYLGYAQYHGNDGRDWIVPLERENGEWKIAHSRPFGRNE